MRDTAIVQGQRGSQVCLSLLSQRSEDNIVIRFLFIVKDRCPPVLILTSYTGGYTLESTHSTLLKAFVYGLSRWGWGCQ